MGRAIPIAIIACPIALAVGAPWLYRGLGQIWWQVIAIGVGVSALFAIGLLVPSTDRARMAAVATAIAISLASTAVWVPMEHDRSYLPAGLYDRPIVWTWAQRWEMRLVWDTEDFDYRPERGIPSRRMAVLWPPIVGTHFAIALLGGCLAAWLKARESRVRHGPG